LRFCGVGKFAAWGKRLPVECCALIAWAIQGVQDRRSHVDIGSVGALLSSFSFAFYFPTASPVSMGAIKTQFFLSYAILGSLMPLLGVFLKEEKGLSDQMVGLAMSLGAVAMLVTPVLITLMADRQTDSRRILAAAFTLSGTVLTAMYFSTSPLLTVLLFLLHGLAFVAMLPLMDGFFFSYAEQLTRVVQANSAFGMGLPLNPPLPVERYPYPKVRVWGTIGFILPSLVLYVAIERGANSSAIMPCAVAFCLLSILNSFRLPKVERATEASPQDGGGGNAKRAARLPTREALAVLFSPTGRRLCLGLVLAYLVTAAFYAFIAIFYREIVGIPASRIGLVMSIGVFFEILWTLAMPWLQARIRLKGILVLGILHLGVRLVLLAFFPTLPVVLLTQLGHGLEVLALFVVPVMYLNRLAGDRFRNSIQGVFTMTISSTSRIAGALAAGWLISVSSLSVMFAAAGGVGIIAALVMALGFRSIPENDRLGN